MAVKLPVVMEKKERKTRGNQCVLLCPVATKFSEAKFSPAKIGASPEGAARFDRGHFLTKIDTGKTTREYPEKEVVYSQWGAADERTWLHRLWRRRHHVHRSLVSVLLHDS
jgi:hypothetical protein